MTVSDRPKALFVSMCFNSLEPFQELVVFSVPTACEGPWCLLRRGLYSRVSIAKQEVFRLERRCQGKSEAGLLPPAEFSSPTCQPSRHKLTHETGLSLCIPSTEHPLAADRCPSTPCPWPGVHGYFFLHRVGRGELQHVA